MERHEIRDPDTEDGTIGGHPEGAEAVLEKGVDVSGYSRHGGVADEARAIPARQPASPGSDPQAAARGRYERGDGVARQAIGNGVVLRRAAVQPCQASRGANPEIAAGILEHGSDQVASESLGFRKGGGAAISPAGDAATRTDQDGTVAQGQEGAHEVVGESVG